MYCLEVIYDRKFCGINPLQGYETYFCISIFFLELNGLTCSSFIPILSEKQEYHV